MPKTLFERMSEVASQRRPISERMAEAKARMLSAHGSGWKREPKAFYLNKPDLAEFLATDPPMIDAIFRGKPRREHGFDGVPVRPAGGLTYAEGVSRLYSSASNGVQLPD